MNLVETMMEDTLYELKEKYGAIGVKAEFETEGLYLEEAYRLKDLAFNAGLETTIKIGGCGAVKDLNEIYKLGANNIVAPMIETPYAMKKFIKSVKTVFSDKELNSINLLINIETITGIHNFDEIINSAEFENISGIVLGRNDLTESMGLNRKDINSKIILDIACSVSRKLEKINKNLIIGGGVSMTSLDFFKQVPYITAFETRKVIFNSEILMTKNANKGLLKAIDFELMWLKNRKEKYGKATIADKARYKMLKSIRVES